MPLKAASQEGIFCRYYGYYAVVSTKIFSRSGDWLFRKYYGIVCAAKKVQEQAAAKMGNLLKQAL